ncbi:MAG: YCF48-related protein [Pseudomonadota bacterium]
MNKIIRAARRCTAALLAWCMGAQPLFAAQIDDPLRVAARMSPKAAGVMLLGLAQTGTRLVAVGERGVIVYSDNQGGSWQQASVPVSVTLTAVQFPAAHRGWAVGHDGVALSSDDGGISWTRRFDGNQANALVLAEARRNVALAQKAVGTVGAGAMQAAGQALTDLEAGAQFGPSRPLLGLWFRNRDEGYLAGAYGQLFRTVDGGAHWESLAGRIDNPDGLHFNSIAGTPDGTLLIAAEGGKIFRSQDNGARWQMLDSGYPGQLYGVLPLAGGDPRAALLAYGFGGHILVGDADGRHWRELPRLTGSNLVAGLQMGDGAIVLAGQDGTLLRSADQGRHFSVLKAGGGLAVAAMSALRGGAQMALAGVGGVHLLSIAPVAKEH